MVGIAQLVSAPDCGSGGPGFESLYPPSPLGYRQAVRHSTLTAALEGSNPAGPVENRTGHVWLRNMSCSFLYDRKFLHSEETILKMPAFMRAPKQDDY